MFRTTSIQEYAKGQLLTSKRTQILQDRNNKRLALLFSFRSWKTCECRLPRCAYLSVHFWCVCAMSFSTMWNFSVPTQKTGRLYTIKETEKQLANKKTWFSSKVPLWIPETNFTSYDVKKIRPATLVSSGFQDAVLTAFFNRTINWDDNIPRLLMLIQKRSI